MAFQNPMIEISKPLAQIKNLAWDADDWQLYGGAGRDETAKMLNSEIKLAINAHNSIADRARACIDVMKAHRDFGAADTEPMWQLTELFRILHGKDEIETRIDWIF